MSSHKPTLDLKAFLLSHDSEFRALLGPTINLRYSLTPEPVPIEADPKQLHELVIIFLANAKKAMLHGGQLLLQTRDVLLSDTEAPIQNGQGTPYLMLAISDSGNGIHTEMQRRIQQLFSGRWRPR